MGALASPADSGRRLTSVSQSALVLSKHRSAAACQLRTAKTPGLDFRLCFSRFIAGGLVVLIWDAPVLVFCREVKAGLFGCARALWD